MASRPLPTRGNHSCPECGSEVPPATKKITQRVFCSNNCKANHSGRMAARGKALAKISMGWRQTRGSGDLGKFLFSEMTSMLDAWNSEDLAAGRMRADDYAALVTDFTNNPERPPVRYIDRKAS